MNEWGEKIDAWWDRQSERSRKRWMTAGVFAVLIVVALVGELVRP